MKPLNLDKDKIIKLYLKDEKKMIDIAKIMGCSDVTIRKSLLKNNIKLRGRHQSKVYPLEENIFNELLNKSLFHYFLGFYVGDGNKGYEYTNKGRFEIGLKINKGNRILLNEFRTILINIKRKTKQYFEVQGSGKITTYYLFHKKANKEYGMLKLRFGLKTLKLKLDRWGLKIDKKKCFEIPKYYILNKKKFGIFLAGLIDADGCFNFKKDLTNMKLSIALGDLKSCENLKKIIKKLFDIDTNIRKQTNYNILYFNCNHSYKKGIILLKKLNKYIFPYIKLKKNQVKTTNIIYSSK